MGLLNTGCQKVFLGMLLPEPRRADKRLISLCLRHFRITGSKWTVCVHKKTDSHFPIEVCEYKNIACAQRFPVFVWRLLSSLWPFGEWR